MKILVRAPNWIGDQLMAYPFFHFLRKRHPRAQITVACVPWVESIQFRNLVDDVQVLHPPKVQPRSAWRRFLAIEDLAARVRKNGPFDLGYSLPNSFGTAWFLRRSGCRERVGYAFEGRRWLLTDAREVEPSLERHRSQAYLDLLFQPGGRAPETRDFWSLPAENELDPPIPGELPEFPAEAAWPAARPIEPPSEPYWVLAPGSTAESRRWGEDQFAALARNIACETGWTGYIVGGPKEAPIAERLRQDRSLKLKDLTAQGPIVDLWRICREARFTVANDSGMAHFAALCGSPVYVAWGAGEPRRTRPMGPTRVQIEVNAVECWPCERNTCFKQGGDYLRCLKGVEASQLWEQIQAGVLRKPIENTQV